MKKEFIVKYLPTDFCHASTIVKLPDNSLFCCWFGGSYEGKSDVAIWGSRLQSGIWGEPQKLADGNEANWNPVLFFYKDKLWLFYKEGQHISDWKTYIMYSDDYGTTWSDAKELVSGDCTGGRGPVRNKPVLLSDGVSVAAGGSVERGLWSAFADVSSDGGMSWNKSNAIKIGELEYCEGEKTANSDIAVSEQSFYGRGVIQPTVWESAEGKLHMLLRSSEGYIYRSDSDDYGKTWSEAYPTELVNNNSGIDLVKADYDNCLYLVCNPVADNWGCRSPLSLFRSSDNGMSWEKISDLETEPGEFSYPAIIADDEYLHITYTWNRKNIIRVSFSLNELTEH